MIAVTRCSNLVSFLRGVSSGLAGESTSTAVGLEQIAPRPYSSDDKADAGQTAPKLKDVDVESVAPRRPFGPAGASERLPTHNGADSIEQHPCQASLNRRERHPATAVAQHAVVVEGCLGWLVELVGPPGEGIDSSTNVEFGRGHPYPIFERVLDPRRRRPRLHEE
jgi:hypothetical protein